MTRMVDQEKFLTQLEAHKRILYKVANAYCHSPDDRPDLIQEMVIQLWLAYGRFDGRCKFSTWMYRVAMNVAISFYRTQHRHTRGAVTLEALGLELTVTDPRLEEVGDDLRLLHHLISQLDELNRALILLYLDGYSHAEIAEIMGITATNVATRLNRIKQRLQDEFEPT